MTTSRIYYISSGKLDAMYTLRVETRSPQFCSDNYICNLSTDSEKAEAKAREYFDRVNDRIAPNSGMSMVFNGYADFELNSRRGRLSVRQTDQIEKVENGYMPFGKYANQSIDKLDASYVLWWADKTGVDNDPVAAAVVAVCQGIALEKGYIATRQKINEERAEKASRSQFIGEVGKRVDLEGEVVFSKALDPIQVAYNAWAERYIVQITCGDDVVMYFGSNPLANRGDKVKVRATIKAHNERDGVKQTIIQRPVVEVISGDAN